MDSFFISMSHPLLTTPSFEPNTYISRGRKEEKSRNMIHITKKLTTSLMQTDIWMFKTRKIYSFYHGITPNKSHWPYQGGNSTFLGEFIYEIINKKEKKKKNPKNTKI